jgi:hypothetical protein
MSRGLGSRSRGKGSRAYPCYKSLVQIVDLFNHGLIFVAFVLSARIEHLKRHCSIADSYMLSLAMCTTVAFCIAVVRDCNRNQTR